MTTTDCLPCEEKARLARQDTVTEAAEWSGPIGIENQRTGDGRFIEPNALRWDTLPIPLRWAMQDFGAHDGAYVVGKIEAIERLSYEEANERLTASGRDALPGSFKEAVIIWGSGTHDLGGEYGREAYRQVDEGLTPGISMDLDDIVIKEEEDDDSFSIVEGRIRAATQVAIPAFEGARVAVSKAAKEVFDADARLEDLAALSDDGAFNWVDDVGGLPPYIKRIEKHLVKKGMSESHAIATAVNVVKKMCATGDVNFPGAQQVNAGSRAEACMAVASWEEKKARARADAGDTLVASAGRPLPRHEWFQNPRLQGSTEWTVTDEGQVKGYLAMWGTCHIANPQGPKVCTQPPRNSTNYAYFNTQPVRTDKGFVPAGRLTMNTLHAGQRLSSTDTIYHYEHTGAVGAYVVAGEDEHGIWVAGAAHPDADLDALRAAPVSGDWRTIARNLELVGVLSVNVPGFPIPRATALVASGEVQSLVASGMVEREARHEAVQALDLTDDMALRALRDRFRAMDRADAAAALAARVSRLAALEKVRRVQMSLPPRAFAYNEDQWRVPKGNPEGGRWIDMPDLSVNALGDTLESMLQNAMSDEGTHLPRIGDNLEKAREASARASDALRAKDGEGATAAAQEAVEALDDIEADLTGYIDANPDSIHADDAADLGDKIAAAREANTTVANSDLSLLGDDGPGEPGDDIGADEPDIGEEPPDPESSAESEPTVEDPMGEDPLSDADIFGDAGYEDASGDAFQGPAFTDPTGTYTAAQREDGTWEIYDESGMSNGEVYADANEAIGVINEAIAESGAGGDAGGGEARPADEGPEDVDLFKATDEAREAGSDLEQVMMDAIDSGGWNAPEREYAEVGDRLQAVIDALEELQGTVRDGTAAPDAGDAAWAKAKGSLQDLEAMLMAAADKPGAMDDNWANQIGTALDDLFASLGKVDQGLKGSMKPPPFAARKYVRQWLGRRGIRLGRTPVSV